MLSIKMELECDQCGEIFETEYAYDNPYEDMRDTGRRWRREAKRLGWLVGVRGQKDAAGQDYCPSCRRIFEARHKQGSYIHE
jgi:hypothetical protein